MKNLSDVDFLSPREQIGSDWSLKLFIQSDLRNYTLQTHFILDVSSFTEKGDNFIELLDGIIFHNEEAVIIICASDKYAGDEFLDKLVHKGYTNIVANCDTKDERQNVNLMLEDLKECFSEEGLSPKKYRRYDRSFTERPLSAVKSIEAELPTYESASFSVSVIGAQSRIGATSHALHICDYISRRAGKAALVLLSNEAERQRLKDFYHATENGGYITVNNIDIYGKAQLPDAEMYNCTVFDYGDIKRIKTDINAIVDCSDILVLCAGAGWNEISYTIKAQEHLNGINYTLAVPFSSVAECQKHDDKLRLNLNEYIVMPFSPEPFNSKQNDEIFDNLYEGYQVLERDVEAEID